LESPVPASDAGTLTILLFSLVLTILCAARRVLLIFAFAILFAYLIDPVVRFLQRRSLFFKNLRGPHVVGAYLAFLIAAALTVQGLAPLVSTPVNTFLKESPAWLDTVTTGDIAVTIGNARGWSEPEELRLKAFLVDHREKIQSVAGSVEQFASNTMLRKYIRAKVILGGCSLLFYSAAMLLLKFPNAISLGVRGGVLEFVPVAGWLTSATMITGVGILTQRHWIWMGGLLGVWRMAMAYLISPRVLGKNLEIHPLMVLFAVMVGGEIGGIIGIYLSIPLMVVIRVIWRRSVSPVEQPPLPS
jgi:predicted PurR-regulated permease PerM